MRFQVFSRKGIEQFKTTQPHVVVSITDPESDPVEFPKNESRKSILHLQFHDIDVKYKKGECKNCNNTGYIEKWKDFNGGMCYACSDKAVHFNAKDAASILWYVGSYGAVLDLVLIHCEAGRSRSVAVASALDKIYNKTDETWFEKYTPNMFIYRTMLEAHYEKANN